MIKKYLLALAFLCLAPLSALAVDVTISGASFPNYNYVGSSARLRIYASETFVASDSTVVPGGTRPGTTTGFYTTVNCTVASNTLTCPSVTLKSTTDSLDKPSVTYSVKLFDAGNTARDFFPISDFQLPHTYGSTMTWAQVINHNAGARIYPKPTFPSFDQMAAAIAAALGSGYTAAAFRHTTVSYSATPSFDCGTYSSFGLTLTGNVTSSTAACTPTAGRDLTFIIIQDSTGGRTFAWPSGFTDAPTIEARASSVTTATFKYDGANWRFKSKSTEEEGGYALRCDGSGNVHHGNYYPASAAIGNQFYYDAWVRPDPAANGYFVSDGFGGGHAMLWGTSCSGGQCGMNGNVWNVVGASLVSFNLQTGDFFPADKWTHLAVAGYGSDIRTYVNGIPSSVTAFAGTRGSPGGGAGSGNLYVCGSDHSMYTGYVAQIRFFEGWSPLQYAASAFRPAMRLTGQLREMGAASADSYHEPDFMADYTQPGAVIPDLGKGYYGRKHAGVPFNNFNSSPAGNTGEEKSAYPRAAWVYDPTMPFNRQGALLPYPTLSSYSIPSAPAGAKIYDSFTRRDQNYVYEATPSIGSTEPGSLGAKVWNTAFADWGIFAQRLVLLGSNGSVPTFATAYVTSDSADDNVEVTVSSASSKLGAAWRIEDDNNLLFACYITVGVTDSVLIGRYHGGTLQIVQQVTAPATWTRIKGECNGTACAVYLDGSASPIYSWTEGLRLTGTKYGVAGYQSNSVGRVDNVTVKQ